MCTTRTTPEQGVQPERSGGWENNTGCERSSRHCYERSEGRLRLRPGQTTPPHRGGGGTQGDERSEEIKAVAKRAQRTKPWRCASTGTAMTAAQRMSLLRAKRGERVCTRTGWLARDQCGLRGTSKHTPSKHPACILGRSPTSEAKSVSNPTAGGTGWGLRGIGETEA